MVDYSYSSETVNHLTLGNILALALFPFFLAVLVQTPLLVDKVMKSSGIVVCTIRVLGGPSRRLIICLVVYPQGQFGWLRSGFVGSDRLGVKVLDGSNGSRVGKSVDL